MCNIIFLGVCIPSTDIITIDLHGLRFMDAKSELFDCLEGYSKQGYLKFEIVHGFQGGTVLRDYVRGRLKSDFEKSKKNCSVTCQSSSKGSTIVLLKFL